MRIAACSILLIVALFCGCNTQPLYTESQLMMGTVIEVVSPYKNAADIAFKEIARIEDLLSVYKDDSEISQLNKSGRVSASPETMFVIKQAGEFYKATDGAFDITVAPLVQLWGFKDKNFRVPDESEIEDKMRLIGFDKVGISGNIIEFEVQGMKVDLGAIAKGFAIDCAVKKLSHAGITSALLNAGGDIYCLGNKSAHPWRVAVKSALGAGFTGYLEVQDKAVATSGSYEQRFFVGDVEYCHILDPRVGKPADSGVVSVTVIAQDCLTADALATSIFVLGEKRGRELAEEFDAEVRIYNAK